MNTEAHRDVLRGSAQRTVWLFIGVLAVLSIAYLSSGIFVIQPNEVGLLLRFGRVAEQAIPAGIHYALPWPIDQIIHVPIRSVMRLSVDDFLESSKIGQMFTAQTQLGAHLLTGDNNIVTFECILQYSIDNPKAYLFSLTDCERALRSLACNVLVSGVASRPIDDLLTKGKAELQLYVQKALQIELDRLSSGLAITFVELREIRPPAPVQQAFNDVVNSMIDKDQTINKALSYQNEQIPQAKGKAARLVAEAEAYKQQAVAMAQGDADRFLNRLVEFKKTPELTAQQLQFETFQVLLPKLKRHYVVENPKDDPLVRLILPQ